MSYTKQCEKCKGTGFITYLVSMHDDRTETDICYFCKGKRETIHMTKEEEDDYKYNNDSYD